MGLGWDGLTAFRGAGSKFGRCHGFSGVLGDSQEKFKVYGLGFRV